MSARVRDALLTVATTHPASTSVRVAAAALANPKVHLLLVTEAGRLLGTLTAEDLVGAAPDRPAIDLAALEGRTVGPDASLDVVRERMVAERRRRLAVVDGEGRLLGLLCLKRHGDGFCSDADVASRRNDRSGV